jgi:type I restriction enzyme S subunit
MVERLLGDVLEVLIDHRGKTPRKLGGDFVSTGIQVASAINVKSGRLVFEGAPRCVTPEMFARWMPVRLRAGDVLLTSEAPLGEVARVPSNEPLVLGQRLFGLRGRAGVLDNGYLYYALRWKPIQGRLHARATGTTVHGIRQAELVRVALPVPSLAKQRAIVEVLGALDDKIDVAEKIARTAQALAAVVWSSMSHRGSVGGVTKTTLGRLADEGALYFTDGYRTKQSELGEPGVPVLRVADVVDGRLVPSRKDRVREELRVKFAHKVSQPGDVALTTKGSIGRIAMIPSSMPEFVYSPQLCFFRVRPGSSLDRHWLYGWFRGPEFRERAAAVQNQTDMAPYINLADLRETRITLPPPDVQRRTGELIAPLEETAQAGLYEMKVLASLRDTLLPGLLSGQLPVGDVEELAEEAM